ncbi:MAG: hypothetical protein ACTSU5_04310 [Promethearchaeota archaeon]
MVKMDEKGNEKEVGGGPAGATDAAADSQRIDRTSGTGGTDVNTEPEVTAVELPAGGGVGGDKATGRLRWIDQGRGFVMFLLVFTLAFPPEAWAPEGSVMFFLFKHPGVYADYMTVFDVGAAAFIFVIGLLFSVSVRKRLESGGLPEAFKYVAVRYGLLLVLGFILIAAGGSFVEYKPDVFAAYGFGPEVANNTPVIVWDVIPTLGLVGFVTFAFVLVEDPKVRMAAGYAWMLFYQVLLNTTILKAYASASVHGGIFGTVFTYSGIMVVATCIGDYMFKTKEPDEVKYRNMAIFGAVNLAVGAVLQFLPGWEASKRKMTLTHALISIGVTTLGLLVFVYLDRKKDKDIAYLRAFGMNPFFTYFLAETPHFIVKEIIGDDLGFPPWGNVVFTAILVGYTSLVVWYLYKNRKIISTQKAALIFIATTLVLAAILLGTGVL